MLGMPLDASEPLLQLQACLASPFPPPFAAPARAPQAITFQAPSTDCAAVQSRSLCPGSREAAGTAAPGRVPAQRRHQRAGRGARQRPLRRHWPAQPVCDCA